MKAGIIAAGDGVRLTAMGVRKPLVRIGQRTLLERTLSLLIAAAVEEVCLIVNEGSIDVVRHARDLKLPFPLHIIVKSTDSSMHSLRELSSRLCSGGPPEQDRFILCTVDSIVSRDEFVDFVENFRSSPDADVLLSYTDFVDDESPLRIAVDDHRRVLALGPAAVGSPFVTAGAYGMNGRIWSLAETCIAGGKARLRTLLASAVEAGLSVSGHRFSKAIDVDRPEDIGQAERFVSELGSRACSHLG